MVAAHPAQSVVPGFTRIQSAKVCANSARRGGSERPTDPAIAKRRGVKCALLDAGREPMLALQVYPTPHLARSVIRVRQARPVALRASAKRAHRLQALHRFQGSRVARAAAISARAQSGVHPPRVRSPWQNQAAPLKLVTSAMKESTPLMARPAKIALQAVLRAQAVIAAICVPSAKEGGKTTCTSCLAGNIYLTAQILCGL